MARPKGWCGHVRTGRVTNQPDGYDPTRPHASMAVCDREKCIAYAIKEIAGETNETASYVADN